MTKKAITETLEQVIERPKIPDGTYEGVWGGYELKFTVPHGKGERHYRVRTEDGIRTQAALSWVHVKDGQITVETKTP